MKPGGGRAKGSSFERKVAKMIVAAFAKQGITKEDCYRTPGSGGHKYACKVDPGDLVLSPKLQKLFNFGVECKFYKSLDWAMLLRPDNRRGDFGSWWRQAVKATQGTSKCPLLVFKGNRSDIFVMFPHSDTLNSSHLTPSIRTTMDGVEVRICRLRRLLGYMLWHNTGSRKGLAA